eukprot:322779_1
MANVLKAISDILSTLFIFFTFSQPILNLLALFYYGVIVKHYPCQRKGYIVDINVYLLVSGLVELAFGAGITLKLAYSFSLNTPLREQVRWLAVAALFVLWDICWCIVGVILFFQASECQHTSLGRIIFANIIMKTGNVFALLVGYILLVHLDIIMQGRYDAFRNRDGLLNIQRRNEQTGTGTGTAFTAIGSGVVNK